jgi:RHS repeat-associated protein
LAQPCAAEPAWFVDFAGKGGAAQPADHDYRGLPNSSLSRTTATAYDAVGNVVSVTDPRGTITSFAYDALNRLTTTIAAFGTTIAATTVGAYDAVGNVLSFTDPNNLITSYAYDALNRQTTTIAAYGTSIAATTATAYDALDNVTKVTNPRGYATLYAYDALNRLTTITDALSNVATLGYDPVGNVIRQTDANGHATQYAYDPLNRPISQTDPVGNVTSTTYDANNNVASTIDALGYATQYGYDPLDRRTTATDPANNVTTTAYDPADNVTSVTDPLGHVTQYGYDPLNRQVTMTDARGGVTTTGYDPNDNVTSLIDPVGNQTQFTYDALNRLTQQTDPLNHSATFAYDLGSRLTSSTDRNGRQQNFQYDPLNRQTTVTWVAAGGATTDTRVYGYDQNGNLTSASNSVGAYALAYDALDRMSSQQDPYGLSLTFTYDAVGNQTLVQDSFGGVTTSVYDADNRLTSRQFGGSGQTALRVDLGYTLRGQLAWEKRFSDVAGTQLIGSTSLVYDVDMRLANEQQHASSGSMLANYTYTYDQASRLASETDNGVTTSYTYDAVNQLTSDGTRNYSYDLGGNRTGGSNNTGPANQLTTDGTWNFTYDNEGNLTKAVRQSDGLTWTYSYDNENHLTGAQQRATDGGTLLQQATYVFDALDNRTEKDLWTQSSGTTATTRFGYDLSGASPSPLVGEGRGEGAQAGGGVLWADLSGSNALQTRYLHGDAVDQLFARITGITGGTGGTAAWYLTDRQGSVRNLTDSSGNLQDTITYDPFGNVLTESNTSFGDRFKYTGREVDSETGLQYNRARVYDAVHGRWLSQDPLGFSAGDTNLYRYVANQPTGATDPSGQARVIDNTGGAGQPGTDPWLPPTNLPDFGSAHPGQMGMDLLPGLTLPGPLSGGIGEALGKLPPDCFNPEEPGPFKVEDPGFETVRDPVEGEIIDPYFRIAPDANPQPGERDWASLLPPGLADALGRADVPVEPPNVQDPGFYKLPDPGQENEDPYFNRSPDANPEGGKHLADLLTPGLGEAISRAINPAPPTIPLDDPAFQDVINPEDPSSTDPYFNSGPSSPRSPRHIVDLLPPSLMDALRPGEPPSFDVRDPGFEHVPEPNPFDLGDPGFNSDPNAKREWHPRSIPAPEEKPLIIDNTAPPAEHWAGPAIIDPNAPPLMSVAYGDEEKFPR